MDYLIDEARAVAQGLKDTAEHCGPDQDALRVRLLDAAYMILRLVHRIRQDAKGMLHA
jgi:hypothetical protein